MSNEPPLKVNDEFYSVYKGDVEYLDLRARLYAEFKAQREEEEAQRKRACIVDAWTVAFFLGTVVFALVAYFI